MNDLLTVKATASLLGLNLQTVYRKIYRGEIDCRRIGRTIRVPRESLDAAPKKGKRRKGAGLPSFLRSLFWDVDFSQLSPASPLVLERTLEYGDLAAVRWILGARSAMEIRRYLESTGARRLSRKSLSFWQNMLGVRNASGNSHRRAEETLGETRWR